MARNRTGSTRQRSNKKVSLISVYPNPGVASDTGTHSKTREPLARIRTGHRQLQAPPVKTAAACGRVLGDDPDVGAHLPASDNGSGVQPVRGRPAGGGGCFGCGRPSSSQPPRAEAGVPAGRRPAPGVGASCRRRRAGEWAVFFRLGWKAEHASS